MTRGTRSPSLPPRSSAGAGGVAWSRGFPLAMFLIALLPPPADAVSGRPVYAHQIATGGTGTDSDPWVDWEAAVAPDQRTIFVAGYYESDTAAGVGDGTVIECHPGAVLRRVQVTDKSGTYNSLFLSTSGPENVQVTGCTFDNEDLPVDQADIHLSSGPQKIVIRDNRWINQRKRVSELVYVMGGADHGRWIEVSNNRVIGGSGAGVGTPNSFMIHNMSDVRVDDNVFDEFGGINIQQYSLSNAPMRRIAVRSNIFRNLNQTHIFVRCTWQENGSEGQPIEEVTLSDNIATSTSMTENKGLIALAAWQGGFSGGGGEGEEQEVIPACRIRDVTVHGNVARGLLGHFIIVGGIDGVVENASLVGNSFDGREPGEDGLDACNTSAGINAAAPGNRNLVIAGNTLRYTGRGCIRSGADNVTISNNSLEYCAQNEHDQPDPSEEAAVLITGTGGDASNNVTVSGNTIRNTHNSGLAASYGSTSAIRVSSAGSPTSVQITGNTILDNRGSSPGMHYGISIGRSPRDFPTEVTVAGNQIFGYITAPWLSDGTAGSAAEHRRFFGNVTDETYTGWPIGHGLGAAATQGSCLLYEAATDAIFEDRDCDGVKGAAEGYIGDTSARTIDSDGDGNPEVQLGTCGSSPCLAVDLDSDGNVDVCLVDGGTDSDCDGAPD